LQWDQEYGTEELKIIRWGRRCKTVFSEQPASSTLSDYRGYTKGTDAFDEDHKYTKGVDKGQRQNSADYARWFLLGKGDPM